MKDMMSNVCLTVGIGTFQSYYETDLLKEYSASTIAWIPSMQIFFIYAMASTPKP